MITVPGYLLILWFLTGAMFGYTNAKYTRRKKQAVILFAVQALIALGLTAYFAIQGG